MGLYDMPGMLGASSGDVYGAGGEQDELSAMQPDEMSSLGGLMRGAPLRKKKSVASQMALPLILGALSGLGGKAGIGAAAPLSLLVQALMTHKQNSAGGQQEQQPWNEKPPVAGNSGSSGAGILGILGKLFGGQ